jgi:type IV pilus assembly protein PilY1
MELEATTGAQPPAAVFDINKNGTFDVNDYVAFTTSSGTTADVPPSGRQNPGVGIVPMPAILSRAAGEREYKYMSGSSGTIDVVAENPGERTDFARDSWQQHGVLE